MSLLKNRLAVTSRRLDALKEARKAASGLHPPIAVRSCLERCSVQILVITHLRHGRDS
ncbi:hypothetical protein R75461_08104 [Paraburkholderia nemoris]|nr:hypothetical protein R75461_08104 [Paraburkholderia nemoris]